MNQMEIYAAMAYKSDALERSVKSSSYVFSMSYQDLFMELKKFLICSTASNTITLMPHPDLDEIWHEFILCTRDYVAFCNILGVTYIHHQRCSGDDDLSESDVSIGLNSLQEHYAKFFGDMPEFEIYEPIKHIERLTVTCVADPPPPITPPPPPRVDT